MTYEFKLAILTVMAASILGIGLYFFNDDGLGYAVINAWMNGNWAYPISQKQGVGLGITGLSFVIALAYTAHYLVRETRKEKMAEEHHP